MGTINFIFPFILLVTLLIAVYTDVKFQRIYNWLTFPVIVLGILLHSVTTGIPGLLLSLAGIGVASLALLLFLLSGAMGAGDVKLLCAVGALIGPGLMGWTLLCTVLAGGVCGVVYAARRGVLDHTLRNAVVGGHALAATQGITMLKGMACTSKAGKMPYAPAIALGVMIVTLLRHTGVL